MSNQAMDGRPLAGLRALVIEDDYFIADDLKRILKREGADFVKLSGDMADALRRVRDEGFDVALLNLNLHGEMAFPLADELIRRGIAFAFVSGVDRTHIPPRFAAVPNWGKPYDDGQIVREIRHLRPGTAAT